MVAADEPFKEPVSQTSSASVPAAAAVKVAVVAPEVTTTFGGIVTAALLLENDTVAPPPGAAPTSVTVQLVELPLGIFAGLQFKKDTCGGDNAMPADLVLPLAEAVIMAVPSAVTEKTVPQKLPVADPAGIKMLAGTTTCELLLDKPTHKPRAGASALRETVQETLPALANVVGEHVSPVKLVVGCRMVTKPPEAFAGMEFPAPLAVVVPPIWIAVEVDLVLGERFNAN
jgi:hypothetical protein